MDGYTMAKPFDVICSEEGNTTRGREGSGGGRRQQPASRGAPSSRVDLPSTSTQAAVPGPLTMSSKTSIAEEFASTIVLPA